MAQTIDVSNPESVMAFQKAAGLNPDGQFGPKTLAKLREIQGA
jgi:peptidoglycan hydrolase-like protein with peptidoglycan-binding domain